jgi:ribose 5-phosphate isomerase A
VTDNHGYVLDCAFGTIAEPATLEQQLRAITGVTVTGLFVGMAEAVVLADGERVETLHRA